MIPERVKRFLFGLEDRLFDWRNRIDTRGVARPAPAAEDLHAQAAPHATSSQAVWTRNLRVLIRQAAKVARHQLFVDIGAGKGKACIYAARRFPRAIGVEYAAELVREARDNQKRAGIANIEFVHADAANYELPEESALVFLFNPFDEVILRRFLARNRARIQAHHSVIAYANDLQRQALADAGLQCVFRDPLRSISLWR